ncbi:LuxR family transcriptional regulator [Bradyrhizobium sp. Gha]|uniref:LuxR family transcriptional regulator n=1 Tax=Bradyrhizobium sp. Gha TaxID=1855318 RepID=UPI001FCDA9CA|nr:LuxR family transcriptional regulator [Bradyrhizobium sp. Gha]
MKGASWRKRERGPEAWDERAVVWPVGSDICGPFASAFDDADPQERIGHLNTLACLFDAAYSDIARPGSTVCEKKAMLSKRELSCMRWVAEGKSSWEIGMILEISKNTVNFHVKNPMRKLGANSRIQAVTMAIRLDVL